MGRERISGEGIGEEGGGVSGLCTTDMSWDLIIAFTFTFLSVKGLKIHSSGDITIATTIFCSNSA